MPRENSPNRSARNRGSAVGEAQPEAASRRRERIPTMPRSSAIQWLSEQTRTGAREMPSNVAWTLSRLLQPAEKTAGTVAESAAAGARKAGAAVIDITPGLGELGNSG